jgi:hypothetical protein
MEEAQEMNGAIASGEEFELLSSADGASYILRSKIENTAAHLHGEDAERLRSEFDAIVAQYPDWKPDQTLAQLWDQGGYSWLASQDDGC